MTEHGALGHAGGAPGVLQEGDVAMAQRHLRQWVGGTLRQGFLEAHRLRKPVVGHHLLDVLEHEVDQRALGEAEQVADAGGDDVLHLGLGHHLLQRGGEVVQHHDDLGAGIVELVPEFACGVHRVGVDHHQPRTQRAEQGDRVLQHVGHHDRDAIALGQSEHAGEIAGELAAEFIDLAVAELLAEVGEGRALAEALEGLFEYGGHRSVGVEVDLGGDALRIVIQPRTLVAHVLARLLIAITREGDTPRRIGACACVRRQGTQHVLSAIVHDRENQTGGHPWPHCSPRRPP